MLMCHNQSVYDSIFAEADKARQEAGGSRIVQQPPTNTRTWNQPKNQVRPESFNLCWINDLFGTLTIEGQGVNLGEQEEGQSASTSSVWTEVTFLRTGSGKENHPEVLTFHLDAVLQPGVSLFQGQGKVVIDVTERIPVFRVPVKWNEVKIGNEKVLVPSTRVPDQDNIDLVFLSSSGMFVEIQISITTRHGKFWLGVQEVYSGQIVRTTHDKARKIPLQSLPIGSLVGLVVPLYAENAAPGADYLKSFKMGPQVIKWAFEKGATVPLSECVAVKWQPDQRPLPEKLAQSEWSRAVVLFFNIVIGFGFAQLDDGRTTRIYFDKVVDEDGAPLVSKGEFPVLQPMTAVAVRVVVASQGKLDARSIRTF